MASSKIVGRWAKVAQGKKEFYMEESNSQLNEHTQKLRKEDEER